MKRRDLIKKLEENGWRLIGNGTNHDIYAKGNKKVPIPRHREIPDECARDYLKQANVK